MEYIGSYLKFSRDLKFSHEYMYKCQSHYDTFEGRENYLVDFPFPLGGILIPLQYKSIDIFLS